ncbi:MAG: FAD-binding protein, partial [Pseudomonadota bacterium]
MQDLAAIETPDAGLSDEIVAAFQAIVGPEHALSDPDQQTPYLNEWRGQYTGVSPLIVRPGTVEEVSKCLALANANGIPIVPQAGNTGLVGGQTPHRTNTEVVLTVERLKRVRDVDPAG